MKCRIALFTVVMICGLQMEAFQCKDLMAGSEAAQLQSLIDQNYYFNSRISSLVHKLQSQGVRLHFWDPSDGGKVPTEHRYVLPELATIYQNEQFYPEQTTLFLPYQPQQLLGGADSLYRLRQIFRRIINVFELQKQGVVFSSTSLEIFGKITILKIRPKGTAVDSAVTALSYLFSDFGYGSVSFEPRESRWEQNGFLPTDNYVVNPDDNRELLMRIQYFENEFLWQSIAEDLEKSLFAPYGKSLFPGPDERIH